MRLGLIACILAVLVVPAAAWADEPASQPETKVQAKLVAGYEKQEFDGLPSEPWVVALAKGLASVIDAGEWIDVSDTGAEVNGSGRIAHQFKLTAQHDAAGFLVVKISGDSNKSLMVLDRVGEQQLVKVDGLPRNGTLFLAVRVVSRSAGTPPVWGAIADELRMNLRAELPAGGGQLRLVGLIEHVGDAEVKLPSWESAAKPPLAIARGGKPVATQTDEMVVPTTAEPEKPPMLGPGVARTVMLNADYADGTLVIKSPAVGRMWTWKLPPGEYDISAIVAQPALTSQTLRLTLPLEPAKSPPK